MIWSIETDDFSGVCGEKYPLLKTLNAVLRTGQVPGKFHQNTLEPIKFSRVIPGTNIRIESAPGVEENLPSKPAPPVVKPPTTPSETPSRPPSTPSAPPSSGVCKREGFNRDPVDCNKFYNCMNEQGSYRVFEFYCPDGLVFNPDSSVCDYRNNVKC